MVIKQVRVIERADGHLIVKDGMGEGQTLGDSYLRVGWEIIAVLPGETQSELRFIMQAEGTP